MKNYTKTKTDRAWFGCILQHPARNTTTTQPAQSTAYWRAASGWGCCGFCGDGNRSHGSPGGM